MTWKLTLIHNHKHSKENCLTLTHLKRNHTLRQWFGPIANHLFNHAIDNCKDKLTPESSQTIIFDKQTTQSFLINASFYQQQCLHRFQIFNDLRIRGLESSQELSELLLYLRMTYQHPCHQHLQLFADCHLPFSLDFEASIESLINAKLVQKIEISNMTFYDKNPFPHDHIFDQQSLSLKDHDGTEKLNNHQNLVCQQVS